MPYVLICIDKTACEEQCQCQDAVVEGGVRLSKIRATDTQPCSTYSVDRKSTPRLRLGQYFCRPVADVPSTSQGTTLPVSKVSSKHAQGKRVDSTEKRDELATGVMCVAASSPISFVQMQSEVRRDPRSQTAPLSESVDLFK